MLVEDDNNLREIYGARLLAEGHEIVAAKDGEEALAIAVKEKPDLIISDVMMPKISGFDMLDILRNAPETKFTKVIMMTALSQTEDKARADSLGADRYLVKSQVTLEDVAKVVKDVLEGKTETDKMPNVVTEDPIETPAEEPEVVEVTEPAPTEEPEAPAIEAPSAPEPVAETPVVTIPEVPAPEPAPVTVETAPEVTPVIEPTIPVTITASDPVDPAVDSASPVTPITITAPADDPATPVVSDAPADDATAPEPTVPAIIVELPKIEVNQEETGSDSATPVDPPTAESTSENTNIGPNLAEALQEEIGNAEDQISEEPASKVENTTSTIVNGAESSVITPTETPEQSAPEAPVTEETPIEEGSNLLKEETKRKGIIQPINDINSGLDLNALLDAEEKKAPVENPPANTVITPTGTAPTVPAPAPAPQTDHDIISL